MRIIAGKYKGRKLCEFDGKDVRPTSDRAREALFSMLQFEIADKKFLDGFCGSGAVGIEALSRGACEVVFTDFAKSSCELTKKNLKLVGENARVINTDCVKFLSTAKEKFDIVFLDPPYMSDAGLKAAEIIGKRKLLSENGLLILERGSSVNQLIEGLFIEKRKKYGIAEFTFYRKTDEDTCVFAGSFDPVTNGHIEIVKKAKERYERVIVALGINENKKCAFDKYTRLKMLHAAFDDMIGVTVTDFDGLLVDFMKKNRITDNVRGIRNDKDAAYEEKMYTFNKAHFPELKNVYINADENMTSVSSTLIRQLLSEKGDISTYLPEKVAEIALNYDISLQK